MVGQHDAAGTHPNRGCATSHMPDQYRSGCAGNARHAVVFGQPITLETQAFRVTRQVQRVAERLGGVAAFGDGGEVEYGKWNHVQLGFSAWKTRNAA